MLALAALEHVDHQNEGRLRSRIEVDIGRQTRIRVEHQTIKLWVLSTEVQTRVGQRKQVRRCIRSLESGMADFRTPRKLAQSELPAILLLQHFQGSFYDCSP